MCEFMVNRAQQCFLYLFVKGIIANRFSTSSYSNGIVKFLEEKGKIDGRLSRSDPSMILGFLWGSLWSNYLQRKKR